MSLSYVPLHFCVFTELIFYPHEGDLLPVKILGYSLQMFSKKFKQKVFVREFGKLNSNFKFNSFSGW